MARIGVALSGGGHRAALIGLGVLLYLDLSRDDWSETARASARIPSTAVNLHVIFGYPLVDLPGRARFEELVA